MLLSPRRVIGLDIGDGSVKAVEAEREGKTLRVLHAASRSLPPALSPSDPDALGAFLRDFLGDCGFRSRAVYMGFPRHQAVMRTATIPPADEAQTQQMIRFQARKTLPLNGEGLLIGYLLREAETDRIAVIVGGKKDVYDGLRAAAGRAGLSVLGVTLSSFGAANAYLNAFPDAAPGVVVDVGSRMTEITLSAWGRFASSREASIGSEDLIKALGESTGQSRAASSQAIRNTVLGAGAPAGAMQWAGEIAAEVGRTLRAFATDGLPAPERVLLTGGGSQIGGFPAFLSAQIGMPVEPFPANAGIGIWPQGLGADPGALFLPALGYLLGGFAGIGTRFDFGADFFRRADARPRATRKWLSAAAVLALLAGGWLVPDHYLSRMEEDAKKTEEKLLKDEKAFQEENDALLKKLKDLRSWTRNRADWIDVLREITVAVPETKDVFLTQANFREGGEALKILGRAVSEDAVNRFVNALNRSTLFRRVERRTIQQHRDRSERHKWDFEVTGYMVEPEEEVVR
jgi:type IV pilus assembly protein PilM